MRFDLIESLHFYKLRDGWDRRGPIVLVKYSKVANGPYAEQSALMIVKNVIALLNNTYGHIPDDMFGEQDSCWIEREWTIPEAIVVRHKYWSDREIAAFKRILRTLAALHGWTVTDDE